MDSIRISKTATVEPVRETTAYIIGLLFGIVMIAIGVKLDSGLFAGIGFLPFAISFIYLNGTFWTRIMGDKVIPKGYADEYKYRV